MLVSVLSVLMMSRKCSEKHTERHCDVICHNNEKLFCKLCILGDTGVGCSQ